MPADQRTLSLKARLGLVALLALVLGLIPSGLLLRSALSDLAVVANEQRGLPLNRDWQAVLRQLQQHRQTSTEALSTRPAARAELAARRSAVKTAVETLRSSIQADGQLDPRHGKAIEQIEQAFSALSAEVDKGGIDVGRLLARHQALAEQAFVAIAEINEDSGLLLDPVPSSYFAIVAGLQAAPRVEDALSELASIARAAAVDDAAGVSAALTRYREHGSTMVQQMQAAERSGGALAEDVAAMANKALEQRHAIDKTMRAVALDVNYPLDQLAQSFDQASKL